MSASTSALALIHDRVTKSLANHRGGLLLTPSIDVFIEIRAHVDFPALLDGSGAPPNDISHAMYDLFDDHDSPNKACYIGSEPAVGRSVLDFFDPDDIHYNDNLLQGVVITLKTRIVPIKLLNSNPCFEAALQRFSCFV